MEFNSRVREFIFSWDMHNFINDSSFDDKLETILSALTDNNIKNITLINNIVDMAKEGKEGELEALITLAGYLNQEGNHLAVIETPIPKNIKKENNSFKSWTCYGFSLCKITVIMIKSIEYLPKEIEEIEEKILEEVYKKENKEQ